MYQPIAKTLPQEVWHGIAASLGNAGQPPSNKFELLLEEVRRVRPREAGTLLAILLATLPQQPMTGCEALWPLWADEAMHRALSMVRLEALLDRGGERLCSGGQICRRIDLAVAKDLAALYRSLEIGSEREGAPCSTVLREVVTNLSGLFGASVSLRTAIERLNLPRYQRRALVLAASELVINALTHAYGKRSDGKLLVVLRRAAGEVRLVVADDGIGCDIDPGQAERGVAGGLAALLGGSLSYSTIGDTGTWAEISFRDPSASTR